MPIIATVGAQPFNQATMMMKSYLETLIALQKTQTAKINPVLQALYGSKAEYPDFRFVDFES